MIECPTCGNEVFRIHDEPTTAGGQREHIIECTKCCAAWTLGFEDEEVCSDSEEETPRVKN